MKTLFTLLTFSFLAVNAHAATPQTLLQYLTTNGSVNPMYGSRTDCAILDNGTVVIHQLVGDIMQVSKPKPILWKGVPNEIVLKSLIAEASQGQVIDNHGFFPVGGPVTTYLAYQGKKQTMLQVLISQMTTKMNNSPVTPRLVKFLNTNCKKSEAI